MCMCIHLHTKTEKERKKKTKKALGRFVHLFHLIRTAKALLTCIVAGTTSPQAPGPGLSLLESYRSSAKAAS